MEDMHIYLFAITTLGAIYMLYHGLTTAGAIETVTGAAFAVISFAVFVGFDMQDSIMYSVRTYFG